MKKSISPLGETEMEILRHVWDLGNATVADVHSRILEERKIAYTTVMTVMKNLAEKGYLSFEKLGMAYVYTAAIPPNKVKQTLLCNLMNKVFDGSPTELIQTLVNSERIPEKERNDLIEQIKKMEGL